MPFCSIQEMTAVQLSFLLCHSVKHKILLQYSFHFQWCLFHQNFRPGLDGSEQELSAVQLLFPMKPLWTLAFTWTALQYNFHPQYDASLLQTRYGKYTTFISNGATQAGTSKGWCTASIPNGATLDFTRWELITNENPPVLIQLAQSWHPKLLIVP